MSKRDASPERLGLCAECEQPRKVGDLFVCTDCRKGFDPCVHCWREHPDGVKCSRKNNIKKDFLQLLETREEELGFKEGHYRKLIRRDLSWLQ